MSVQMMHTDTALYNSLSEVANDVSRIITNIKESAAEQDIDPYKMQGPNGDYVLTPLLLARSQALSGMAHLKINRDESRRKK